MELNVGIVQVRPVADLDANREYAFGEIRRMADEGAQVVILPEMWPYPYHAKWFVENAQETGGELWRLLSEAAAEAGVWLIAGSVAERRDGKIYNTCYVFDDKGAQVAEYSKTHLFDADVTGLVRANESSVIEPGDHVTTFESPWGTCGLCICYDIRFPELFTVMERRGARIIFCPAAFSTPTGVAHWRLTARMRALDTQTFLVGCDAGRNEDAPYVSYGHSVVCDPWGTVLWEAGEGRESKLVTLDLDMIDRMRAELPVCRSRRDDLYEMVEKSKA